MNVMFWRLMDGQEKSSGFVLCPLSFALFFSDGETESSEFQWNPESSVFLFCGGKQEKSSGFRIPLEYGRFQSWIPVESE
jgi:hypothetical protein